MLKEKYTPQQILNDLNILVSEYNERMLADDDKCRWETVFTVMAVAGRR